MNKEKIIEIIKSVQDKCSVCESEIERANIGNDYKIVIFECGCALILTGKKWVTTEPCTKSHEIALELKSRAR